MILARLVGSSCCRMESETRLARSLESVDMARTLTAREPDFLVHSVARSSSGRMEQKMRDSLMVNWRASSRGSKSRMLRLWPVDLQFRSAFSWLLLIMGAGMGVSGAT